MCIWGGGGSENKQNSTNLWFCWVSQIHFVQDEQLGSSSEHEFEIGIATREWDMGIVVMEMHWNVILKLWNKWGVLDLLCEDTLASWTSMTQSQNCNRLAMSLDPDLIQDHSSASKERIIGMWNQECKFIVIYIISSGTFGHVPREPISQWKIGERKLLPKSIHSFFHQFLHVHSWVGYFLHGG